MLVLDHSLQVDYGQDAPVVRLGMMGIGALGAGVVAAGSLASSLWPTAPATAVLMVQTVGVATLLYGVWMASYMTWSSRIGKLKTRDRLLEHAGRLRPWRGDEVVVDVGCGRGLMLIGAAKRLDRGTAFGLDLWRKQDQADSSPERVLANARDEGVADRVRIETGDARKLPFTDASVDVVLSHWVIHNLQLESDRTTALDEMWRVLRPRGVMVLADIANVPMYYQHLIALGACNCDLLDGGWEARIMGFLSGGTYKPQSIVCSKTE